MDIPAADLADLILRAARRLRSANAAELEGLPVNPHQARALRVVAPLEPVRPSAVAERLHVAARSATDVLDFLVAGGWVERSPDPDDRRARLLCLSDSGRALLADVEAARGRGADAVLGRLTPVERDAAASALRRVAAPLAEKPSPAGRDLHATTGHSALSRNEQLAKGTDDADIVRGGITEPLRETPP